MALQVLPVAQTFNIARIATTTTTESSAQSVAVHEVAPNITYADRTVTIGGNLTLLSRIKITRETQGQTQRDRIEYLDFRSTTATFTAGAVTTPFTDAESDSLVLLGYGPWVNMDAVYTANGDSAGA
jgi:hypothetical protein